MTNVNATTRLMVIGPAVVVGTAPVEGIGLMTGEETPNDDDDNVCCCVREAVDAW